MTTLKQLLQRLRPLAVKDIHLTKLAAYTEAFKEHNDGAEPTQEQINHFLVVLISQDVVAKEADALMQEIQAAFDHTATMSLLKNTLFTVPTLTVCGFTAYICFAPQTPSMLTDRGSWALWSLGIAAVVVFVAVLVQSVLAIGDKLQR